MSKPLTHISFNSIIKVENGIFVTPCNEGTPISQLKCAWCDATSTVTAGNIAFCKSECYAVFRSHYGIKSKIATPNIVDCIEKESEQTDDFREIKRTTHELQQTYMCLRVGEKLEKEVHLTTTQVFIVMKGKVRAMVGNEEKVVKKCGMIWIPHNTEHEIVNVGKKSARLISFYAPRVHAHKIRAEGSARTVSTLDRRIRISGRVVARAARGPAWDCKALC